MIPSASTTIAINAANAPVADARPSVSIGGAHAKPAAPTASSGNATIANTRRNIGANGATFVSVSKPGASVRPHANSTQTISNSAAELPVWRKSGAAQKSLRPRRPTARTRPDPISRGSATPSHRIQHRLSNRRITHHTRRRACVQQRLNRPARAQPAFSPCAARRSTQRSQPARSPRQPRPNAIRDTQATAATSSRSTVPVAKAAADKSLRLPSAANVSGV